MRAIDQFDHFAGGDIGVAAGVEQLDDDIGQGGYVFNPLDDGIQIDHISNSSPLGKLTTARPVFK